jgi:hypothetical protein
VGSLIGHARDLRTSPRSWNVPTRVWSTLPYPLSGDRVSSSALIGGSAMWLGGPGHSAAEQAASWKVISWMQAAFAGTTPIDTALDEAEKAATDKITAYREQAGQ